jgi:AcrR family transcriptional regulator
MLATAAIAQEKGYAASTIADITDRAGVDRRAFNSLFSDKQEAYIALISLGFRRTMAVTIRAFSTGADWPDRIWDAGRAFTQFFQANPSLAHVGFVEPYAVGPQAASQMEGSLIAFTIFLNDGVREAPETAKTGSPRVLEAVATSILETGYQEPTAANPRDVTSAAARYVHVPRSRHGRSGGEQVHRGEAGRGEVGRPSGGWGLSTTITPLANVWASQCVAGLTINRLCT